MKAQINNAIGVRAMTSIMKEVKARAPASRSSTSSRRGASG